MKQPEIAIHAITRNGARQAEKLQQKLQGATLFINEKFCQQFPLGKPLKLPLAGHFADCFSRYQQHICFFSIGITSRLLAPLLVDKRSDPGVICIDEQASFCVPVLSGHRGGANAMALQIAELIGSTPVLTTASDASATLSVDLLGAPFGWELDPATEAAITPVSAAVVNDNTVLIVQECGERSWWRHDHPMPSNLHWVDDINGVDLSGYCAVILISERADALTALHRLTPRLSSLCVLWRPKTHVLGIGCDRNTPLQTLRLGLEIFLEQKNLSADSVASLASIDLKADEEGLLALSSELQIPFVTYSAADLDGVTGIENPSETVKRCIGVSSVAEAAALFHAKRNKLDTTKWKYHRQGKNMTLASCCRQFSETEVATKIAVPEPDTNVQKMPESKLKSECRPQYNIMGSEVVPSFNCKPKYLDPERPMLYYRHHIMLCSGARCVRESGKQLPAKVRELVKSMGLNRGENRIKVSRTLCNGACRNRTTAVIYENFISGDSVNNNHALWLRNIEKLEEHQWRAIFSALIAGENLRAQLPTKHLATVEFAPSPQLIAVNGEDHETISTL